MAGKRLVRVRRNPLSDAFVDQLRDCSGVVQRGWREVSEWAACEVKRDAEDDRVTLNLRLSRDSKDASGSRHTHNGKTYERSIRSEVYPVHMYNKT